MVDDFNLEDSKQKILKEEIKRMADEVSKLYCDIHRQNPKVIMSYDESSFRVISCCNILDDKVRKIHNWSN